jgi:hypothetical protein
MATPEQERAARLDDFIARARVRLDQSPGPDTEAQLRQEADHSGDPDWGRALDLLSRAVGGGPAAPPAGATADDFRSRLRALLESRGPYSRDVADLLASGRSQFPQQYADAYQLVQTWRQSHPPGGGKRSPTCPRRPTSPAAGAPGPSRSRGEGR